MTKISSQPTFAAYYEQSLEKLTAPSGVIGTAGSGSQTPEPLSLDHREKVLEGVRKQGKQLVERGLLDVLK